MSENNELDLNKISGEVEEKIRSLLDAHPQKSGSIFVVGCSSSEICGGKIGKDSSAQAGKTVFETAWSICREKGLFLACQCCEHLNRALVVEEECAEKYNLTQVSAVPWLHGGGSLATAAYYGFKSPVLVESIKASAGIDIGLTMIGMHLKEVAVPVHFQDKIGQAITTAAYSRPKLIGGERARYSPDK